MNEHNAPNNFDSKKQIKVCHAIYPQVYSYILPDLTDHNGWQKVGYTERRSVDDRIREQTQTAAAKLNYHKLWSASTVNPTDHSFFTDHDLHKFYVKNGIKRSSKQAAGGFGDEWFYFDGTPERSKELFNDYVTHDYRDTVNVEGGGII